MPLLVTVALSAFLLFQVQPIMGRYVLPWFGGGPAVWTNCLLFFQALLLAGYAYAHWLGSLPKLRRQAAAHILLLGASLAFLPIGPRAEVWRPVSSGDPSGRILLLLAASVGGPYLLLSATGPLLQRWFSLTEPGRSPWRLYALSNLGSFLALLSYPFAMEPFLRLHTEVAIWSILYMGFVAVCVWTAWHLDTSSRALPSADREPQPDERPTWRTVLFWLALAAAGSTVLLATTNQISQEIAVNPFLWVAPLAIYLLTFVLTFERDRAYHRVGFAVAAGVVAPAGCMVQSAAVALSLSVQLLVFLAALFIACMVCHGELARSRPSPRYLTSFYLTIAAGGAFGGVFVALISPHVFTEFSEYPIGLAAACLLGFAGWAREGALAQWTSRNFAVRLPLMALLIGGLTAVVATTTTATQPALAKDRSFYGILRVTENIDGNGIKRELKHGRILHGFQYVKSPQRAWPTTYYGPHSGAAMALNALDRPNRRVAIVGLGAGTMAAWGRPGDTFRFYEINPEVESIARTWFSYLSDSEARTEVVLGDARVQLQLELERGQFHDFDAIFVDAFSSDAIPIHLLTAECADIYAQRLAPGGLLLLHLSNIVLNLEPVAEGLAQHLGWRPVFFVSPANPETGESSASWMLITSNADFLAKSGLGRAGVQWTGKARVPIIWTDDFASLWHVLDFRR
ncbi:MAG TPA: fused MFS/spermidine synthase [Bryobacteraceae bacterium]|nr:fused MFS/spermidine synthase [Bryobacteraceae bacterium]